MNVLVAYASKHGSTREIAACIGEELQRAGLTVTLAEAGNVGTLARYDGVVIGSAVYGGHWLSDAKDFVEANRAALEQLPVWLFSSGPLGEHAPPTPVDPNEIARLMQTVSARGHTIFGGRIDSGELNIVERLVARVVKTSGDHRDWEAIGRWSRQIAETLTSANAANQSTAP